MKLIRLITIAVSLLLCLALALPAAAQKMQKAGNTDCGTPDGPAAVKALCLSQQSAHALF